MDLHSFIQNIVLQYSSDSTKFATNTSAKFFCFFVLSFSSNIICRPSSSSFFLKKSYTNKNRDNTVVQNGKRTQLGLLQFSNTRLRYHFLSAVNDSLRLVAAVSNYRIARELPALFYFIFFVGLFFYIQEPV